MHDDMLHEFNPAVVEALRRLPQHIKDERNFRIVRAMQLSCQKSILPKEQWVKYEEVILFHLEKFTYYHYTLLLWNKNKIYKISNVNFF